MITPDPVTDRLCSNDFFASVASKVGKARHNQPALSAPTTIADCE